ncbi:MAG: flavin reductase family protein [Clostridia bacterium]|nr:flavin reductase family protein [Clostridia bacterium]
MKKDLGVQTAVFPMPVLMIASYDENGKVDVMNAAWGTICGTDKIALCISEGHKTFANIRKSGAFTVSLADTAHVREADYFGIASGNKTDDKFERTGMKAVPSSRVNAPIVEDFPIAMECELCDVVKTEHFHAVIGRIVNVVADEDVQDADGQIDASKLNAICFDPFRHLYYAVGDAVGAAWSCGKELL